MYVFIFFSKTEAGHVLKMFLQFWLISASRSYKLGSYKKKKRVVPIPFVKDNKCTYLGAVSSVANDDDILIVVSVAENSSNPRC